MSLTPAESGILAAVLDDALAAGLGDDDTVERLAWAALHEGITAPESAAYDFFRLGRK